MKRVYHHDWPKLALHALSKADEVPACLLPFFRKKKKQKLYVCMMGVSHHSTHMEVRGKLVYFHFYMGPRDPTQVTRVVGQEPLPV